MENPIHFAPTCNLTLQFNWKIIIFTEIYINKWNEIL